MTAPVPNSVRTLAAQGALTAAALEDLIRDRALPLVEPDSCAFVHRGAADAVALCHFGVGLPTDLSFRRLDGSDLWYLVLDLPRGARLEYKLEVDDRWPDQHGRGRPQPETGHQPVRGQLRLRGVRLPDARVGSARSRRPSRLSAGSLDEEPVPQPHGRRDALPSSGLRYRPAPSAPGGPRRGRLPALRRHRRGLGQPHPPWRDPPRGGGTHASREPARGIRGRSPPCGVPRRGAGPIAGGQVALGRRADGPVPHGRQLRRGGVAVERSPLPGLLRSPAPPVGLLRPHATGLALGARARCGTRRRPSSTASPPRLRR